MLVRQGYGKLKRDQFLFNDTKSDRPKTQVKLRSFPTATVNLVIKQPFHRGVNLNYVL